MVVTKTDVSNDLPELTSLITVADGEIVEANTENVNNTTILGPLIVAMNWIIDQGMQAAVESIATALQRFQGGIRVDAIASETTNGDIAITTTSTGKLKYQSGTIASSEVLTVGNYSTLIGTPAGVTVMTGASSVANGTQGLAPQPLAGEQSYGLTGGATYEPIIITDAPLALTGTPSAGQIPVASSSSAAVWTTLNPVDISIVDGRLTLASGTPVTTTNQTAKTTIYFTPYKGNRIALYDGTNWNIRAFTEVSVAVPSTTVTPFDIWAYDNAGTVTLETTNWTNDTTRATALTTQNGVYVKTGAVTRRFLGTGRTTSVSGQTQVTSSSLLLVNYYNLVDFELIAAIPGATAWTTTTTSFASIQANTTVGEGRLEFIVPVQEQNIVATHACTIAGDATTVSAYVGIGIDSTTVNSAQITTGAYSTGANVLCPTYAEYGAKFAAGYHYLQAIGRTNAGGSTIFYANFNSVGASALLAEVKG